MSEINREYSCHVDGKYTVVKPLDDLVRGIKAHIRSVEQRNEYLEKQNQKLKDGHFKDKELSEMKKQLEKAREDLYRGFSITKKEQERIDAWIKKHEKEKHGGHLRGGAIGASYIYVFTPTSIGTFGTIKCSCCGEKFDFQQP